MINYCTYKSIGHAITSIKVNNTEHFTSNIAGKIKIL